MIRPQIQYATRESYGRRKEQVKFYQTYVLLKKDIANILAEAYCPEDEEVTVFVVRGKYDGGWRQYCEYCETWAMRNGKPKIISEDFS